MFGLFKKKVNEIEQMRKLVTLAQIAVATSILEEECAKKKLNQSDINNPLVESEAAFASAVANYLFAKGINDYHKDKFKTEDISSYAIEWVNTIESVSSANEIFGQKNIFGINHKLELVVQSLRVLNTLHFVKHNEQKTPILGAAILEEYGHLYPDAPTLESFNSDIFTFVVMYISSNQCISFLDDAMKSGIELKLSDK